MTVAGRRVAAVTGSTRGIGRATVLALAAGGHDVAVLGHSRPDAAEQIATLARSSGVRATARLVDVADPAPVAALRPGLDADGFAVDVLVDNAAVPPHVPFVDLTEKDAADPSRLQQRPGSGVLSRFGTPDDVAASIVFLAGDAAGCITGQVLGVNGGEHR